MSPGTLPQLADIPVGSRALGNDCEIVGFGTSAGTTFLWASEMSTLLFKLT